MWIKIILFLSFLCTWMHNFDATEITCDEFKGGRPKKYDMRYYKANCTFSFLNLEENDEVSIATPIVLAKRYGYRDVETNASIYVKNSKIVDSKIFTVPPEIFEKFKNLTSFIADDQEIQEVNGNCFKNALNLQYLSLKRNSIKKLEELLFSESINLNEIDFYGNEIDTIDVTAFSNLSNLKKLFLSGNQLKEIKAEHFKDLASLELIDLRFNQLETIPEDLFQKSLKLKYIYLNNNQIKKIGSAFDSFSSIESLFMPKNLLEELDLQNCSARNIVVDNNNLKSLSVSNKTRYVLAYNNKISNIEFQDGSPLMYYLNVSKNELKGEILNSLSQMKSLSILDLSHNNIGPINLTSFLNLEALKILNLQSTNLSGITFGTFSHQTKLEQLDLSYNNLKSINIDALGTLTRLTSLYLEGNSLKEINYGSVLNKLLDLEKIGLSDNLWNCTFLSNMLTKLKTNEKLVEILNPIKNVTNIDGIACYDKEAPVPVTTNPLQHFQTNENPDTNNLKELLETIIKHGNSASSGDFISKGDFFSKVSDLKDLVYSVKADVTRVETDVNLSIAKIEMDLDGIKDKLNKSANETVSSSSQLTSSTGNSDNTVKIIVIFMFVILVSMSVLMLAKVYNESKKKSFKLRRSRSDTNTLCEEIF